MKPTHLAITLALASTVVFALRHRELAALEQRSSTLLLKTQKSIPTKPIEPSAKRTIPFSPQSILAALKAHLATEQLEDAAAADLDARMEALSNEEVRALVSAALLEPDLSSKLLTSLADLIASAGTGENRGLAFNLLLGLHIREQGKTKTLERAVDHWMFKDPAATVVWIRQALSSGRITDPKLTKKLGAVLARAEVMIAPVTSLPRLRNLPDEEQGPLLGAAMQNVTSPADIRALAASVITWPNAEAKNRVFRATMEKLLSLGDFPATAAWIDALPDATPAEKHEAWITLAVRDPNAVANIERNAGWILSKADSTAQPALAATLTSGWSVKDHDATGTWLNHNRTAPWYDAAACEFAQGAARKEPATGFDWALTISDEPLRRKAFQEVMRIWKAENASAAAAYLEASSLPAVWKQDLKPSE